jgi:hypothetical protein
MEWQESVFMRVSEGFRLRCLSLHVHSVLVQGWAQNWAQWAQQLSTPSKTSVEAQGRAKKPPRCAKSET